MLPLIVFTVAFALAARRIDERLRSSLVEFFTALAGATTTIVDWIIFVAPIGVFALVTAASSRAGTAVASATAYYIFVFCVALVLLVLLSFLFVSLFGRVL